MSARAPSMLTFLQGAEKLREILKVKNRILLIRQTSSNEAVPELSPVIIILLCTLKKKPFPKCELLFKDCESLVFLVSVDCDRMQEQVDHSLHPNDSHCYFKRADICCRVERGSFQRNDESPVLDCSERGPLEWRKMWHKGWKRREKALSNNSHLFCVASAFFQTLYFHSAPFCSVCCVNSSDFSVPFHQSSFGNAVKETTLSGCGWVCYCGF